MASDDFFTGKGLLYENWKRGIGSRENNDSYTTIHQSMQICIPVKIKATITVDEDDIVEEIRNFKSLLDEGIITQEEFNRKKKQLLNLD